jgi:hypothetical protein
MDRGYSAFGLALQSSFSLPGMTTCVCGAAPRIELALETRAELEGAWSGSRSAQPWRGQLGDGHELTIEWGTGGDLRFGYSGGAQFLLDAGRARLGCAAENRDLLDWQRLLLSRILPNVSLSLGREGLHAAAVETPNGVVAIAAPSGTGKSTLAVELMRRGAKLFADDFLVLDRARGSVCAHPGGPHLNIDDDAAVDFQRRDMGTVLGSFSGEQWVQVRRASSRARPVAAIVLLQRAPELSLAAEVLAPSPLTLAGYMLGLPDDEPGREAKRFALYSDLAEATTIVRLSAGAADRPADLADALEQALGVDSALPTTRAVA